MVVEHYWDSVFYQRTGFTEGFFFAFITEVNNLRGCSTSHAATTHTHHTHTHTYLGSCMRTAAAGPKLAKSSPRANSMYYTYVHTQCMYIKHRETHTHTHTLAWTRKHTHTQYISHLSNCIARSLAAYRQHQAVVCVEKGLCLPMCLYLACMSSFWAMCMCVAPAAQQLPHYMHTPAGKQLHVFVCMYSSRPTASPIHVHIYMMYTSAVQQL